MYQRGFDGIGTAGLSGIFDTIQQIAGGVSAGAGVAQQIASGNYTPYPGSAPVLYAGPSYQPPQPAPTAAGGSIPTGILLAGAGVLAVVLVMMRRGRR